MVCGLFVLGYGNWLTRTSCVQKATDSLHTFNTSSSRYSTSVRSSLSSTCYGRRILDSLASRHTRWTWLWSIRNITETRRACSFQTCTFYVIMISHHCQWLFTDHFFLSFLVAWRFQRPVFFCCRNWNWKNLRGWNLESRFRSGSYQTPIEHRDLLFPSMKDCQPRDDGLLRKECYSGK